MCDSLVYGLLGSTISSLDSITVSGPTFRSMHGMVNMLDGSIRLIEDLKYGDVAPALMDWEGTVGKQATPGESEKDAMPPGKEVEEKGILDPDPSDNPAARNGASVDSE